MFGNPWSVPYKYFILRRERIDCKFVKVFIMDHLWKPYSGVTKVTFNPTKTRNDIGSLKQQLVFFYEGKMSYLIVMKIRAKTFQYMGKYIK